MRYRSAPEHRNPTAAEYDEINAALGRAAVAREPLVLSRELFDGFAQSFAFPRDYHGGAEGGVWHEKVLEHFIAYTLCDLPAFRRETDVYLDLAAGGSPWAMLLRQADYQSHALDLNVAERFRGCDYYLTGDATRMPFPDGSARAMSLQCAFEMFGGDSDTRLIAECARVLAPGGTVVIVPLYLAVRHCGYSTPEYYGRPGRGAMHVPSILGHSLRPHVRRGAVAAPGVGPGPCGGADVDAFRTGRPVGFRAGYLLPLRPAAREAVRAGRLGLQAGCLVSEAGCGTGARRRPTCGGPARWLRTAQCGQD
jgi:hypothetical protein